MGLQLGVWALRTVAGAGCRGNIGTDPPGWKVLPEWVEELRKQESKCFYRVESDHQEFFDLGAREYEVLSEDPEKIQLTLLKKQDKVIRSNAGASLIDLGDGVACLEFHSKMNVIGGDVVALARWAVDEVEKNWVGLVIGNQGENFSVGANLMLLLLEAQEGNREEIDQMVRAFQQMTLSFRYSARPVVAAPFQRVFGGGLKSAWDVMRSWPPQRPIWDWLRSGLDSCLLEAESRKC